MTKIIHRAETRGLADHGWLKSRHTFSFAHYHNPERMNFGALRVLNDDVVAPGMGFGTHPHADMEIVSIPITGLLAHKDSTGNAEIIHSGDVQIMSAGTGLTHSEYNPDKASEVNFLQIWVLPGKRGISPRYEQKTFDLDASRNRFTLLISPEKAEGSLWINQQARFWQGVFDEGVSAKIDLAYENSGLYIFLINGNIKVVDDTLRARDAIGLAGTSSVTIEAQDTSRVLAIEVPL